jgi:hypothetical protein
MTTTKTIDITPTWQAVTPALMEILTNKLTEPEARKMAEEEILRLARFVDEINQKHFSNPSSTTYEPVI